MVISLTEKYRPKTLNEIRGNTELIQCLKSFDLSDLPNMLFYGPPGTGKTTAIKAMLRYHLFQDVLELNASDSRGIDVVRELIKEFAATKSNNLRIVVLDEADSMSKEAQGALRRIMEDYANTRFCIICNYVRKIIEPIVSRCTKLRFSPVKNSDRLREICLKEGIGFDDEGLGLIEKFGGGDMRKMINDIEGMRGTYPMINKKNALEFFGMADTRIYEEVYELLENGTFDGCKKYILEKELDVVGLINNLSEILIKDTHRHKLEILKILADIEQRINNGCTDSVQVNGLISAFILNRK